MSEHAYVVQRESWQELQQAQFQLLAVAEQRLTHDHQNADISIEVTFPVMACFLVTISNMSSLRKP